MSKVDDLKAEELNRLNNNDDEIFDLESLITDGADARFPIIVKFPKGNETVEAAAMIRPLTSIELNNLSRTSRGSNVSNFGVELLKLALYTKDGKEFPVDLLTKIPAGVVNELCNEIYRISGITVDKAENMKLAKQMLGF
jgi:hypothetical protein